MLKPSRIRQSRTKSRSSNVLFNRFFKLNFIYQNVEKFNSFSFKFNVSDLNQKTFENEKKRNKIDKNNFEQQHNDFRTSNFSISYDIVINEFVAVKKTIVTIITEKICSISHKSKKTA